MIVSFFSVGCLTTGGIVWTTVLQRSVPARMIGRVSSLDWVLSLGLAPLSYALTGPIAGVFGARSTLLWCGDRRGRRALASCTSSCPAFASSSASEEETSTTAAAA